LFERAGLGLDDPAWPGASRSLADELLVPSVVYAPAVLALLGDVDVRAVAHITGGGIPGNLARVLPHGCAARVDTRAWEPPRIFDELQRLGQVGEAEMARVFNLGIGMIVVVDPTDAGRARDLLGRRGVEARVIGEVTQGEGEVSLRPT
jgi:phosphoribosylformylglycinamidine cyclo-ligase